MIGAVMHEVLQHFKTWTVKVVPLRPSHGYRKIAHVLEIFVTERRNIISNVLRLTHQALKNLVKCSIVFEAENGRRRNLLKMGEPPALNVPDMKQCKFQ